MVDHIDGFERHALDDRHGFFSGSLPSALRPDSAGFEELWDLHPAAYHEILMHGRKVKTPRWQQAFGNDYHYTGNVNEAEPVPRPWSRSWAGAGRPSSGGSTACSSTGTTASSATISARTTTARGT